MPYIAPERRKALGYDRKDAQERVGAPKNEGELSYVLALEIDNFLRRQEHLGYDTYTDATSALESLAKEVRRRFLEPYENEKIRENGDVFTFQHKNLGL